MTGNVPGDKGVWGHHKKIEWWDKQLCKLDLTDSSDSHPRRGIQNINMFGSHWKSELFNIIETVDLGEYWTCYLSKSTAVMKQHDQSHCKL